MEVIYTTGRGNSHVIFIDDEDYYLLKDYRWSISKIGNTSYAKRCLNGRFLYLHRQIMNPDQNTSVDHINGNGLDNRKINLRIVTHAQNIQNKRMQKNNTSGFIGVHKASNSYKRIKKFVAEVRVSGKSMHLGYFLTPQEAAMAYNKKASEIYGDFARLNSV